MTVLPEVVNPIDHDYESSPVPLSLEAWNNTWKCIETSANIYEDKTLSKDNLGDDYQLLFVNILLDHVRELVQLAKDNLLEIAKPLRILLLGTAGTGKARTVQTTLQEIRSILEASNLPPELIRCAAPTGTAAFTMKFNATTIHRLIQWTNMRFFDEIRNEEVLDALQKHLEHTQLIFLDEMSMIGRRMMGRIDSRFRQGKAVDASTTESLGNVSSVCIGDPAQCDAMGDEQFRDERPKQDKSDDGNCKQTRLSNIGLSVYAEFEEVVILTHVHRMSHISDPKSDEDVSYNERAERYWNIMHRLRDYNITLDDYCWLCRRKHAKLTLAERTFFQDAPRLMDFRRITDNNQEDKCDYCNKNRLRGFAKEHKAPVIAFDARHEGIGHSDGLNLDDAKFMGLSKYFECAVGAPVLLILNLAVQSGLINGSQGTVVATGFQKGHHPNHDNLACRMPCTIIVNFPDLLLDCI